MGEAALLGQPQEVPEHEIHVLAPKFTQFCVIVPVLNEGQRIRSQLEAMCVNAHLADIVVADGGSGDAALDLPFLESQAVRCLLIKRGNGRLGAQLRMAFLWALKEGYEGIVTVDGNGKDGVDAIPSFLDALAEGFDFVQGSRFIDGGRHSNTPTGRLVAIRLFHAPFVSALARHVYTDTTNGFRAHSARFLADRRVQVFREVFDTYDLLPYLAVQAARLGYAVTELPVSRCYPADGTVPSKLHGIGPQLTLVRGLVRLAAGRYRPSETHLGAEH